MLTAAFFTVTWSSWRGVDLAGAVAEDLDAAAVERDVCEARGAGRLHADRRPAFAFEADRLLFRAFAISVPLFGMTGNATRRPAFFATCTTAQGSI